MWSKKTYDLISILIVILFIGSIFLSSFFVSLAVKSSIASVSEDDVAGTITKNAMASPYAKASVFVSWGVRILALVYWIMILILAIEFHKTKKVSMTDVVVIAIFAPLAIIFYFVTLRKHFKELEMERTSPPLARECVVLK